MNERGVLAALQRQVLELALRATAPIYWHQADTPWPRVVRGGSCFALLFGESIVGVTAAHVFRELVVAQRTISKLISQVGTGLFSTSSLIYIDDNLDIATFHWQTASRLAPIDCGDFWPPPELEEMRGLVLVGYPELQREVRVQEGKFGAWGSLAAVDSFTDTRILVTYDPQRDLPVVGSSVPKPPLHSNMSGCSGGLAMMIGMHKGLLRWFPAGVIIGGPTDQAHGELSDIDLIWLARLKFVGSDGSISHSKET